VAGRPARRLREVTRDDDGLELRERKFVERMMIHGDANRAHRESFGEEYRSKAYMKRPEVIAVLQREQALRSQRYALTADHVLQELSYIIHARNRDLYNEDGTLKSPAELDDATDAAIAGIDVEDMRIEIDEDSEVTTTTRVKKYKRYSKTEAIALAMKLRALAEVVAPTRAEVTGANGAPLALAPPVINVVFGNGESPLQLHGDNGDTHKQ